jgi:hypothetical protein
MPSVHASSRQPTASSAAQTPAARSQRRTFMCRKDIARQVETQHSHQRKQPLLTQARSFCPTCTGRSGLGTRALPSRLLHQKLRTRIPKADQRIARTR